MSTLASVVQLGPTKVFADVDHYDVLVDSRIANGGVIVAVDIVENFRRYAFIRGNQVDELKISQRFERLLVVALSDNSHVT